MTTTTLRIYLLLAVVALGNTLVNGFSASPIWIRQHETHFFSSSRMIAGSSNRCRHRLYASSAEEKNADFALLFDCDGVILETEELHRLAYNEAFRKFQLTIHGEPVEWSVRMGWVLPLSIISVRTVFIIWFYPLVLVSLLYFSGGIL
jgi:hypothetical protein